MIKVTTTNVIRSFVNEHSAHSFCSGLIQSGTRFSLVGGSLKFRAFWFSHYMADTKKAVAFARMQTANIASRSYSSTKNAAHWISRIRVILKDS